MPIIKSAKKALRQNIKRRAKNKAIKRNLKSTVKEIRALVASEKTGDAQKKLPTVYKVIDKAAKTGIIKRNSAARKKSSIAKLLTKTSA